MRSPRTAILLALPLVFVAGNAACGAIIGSLTDRPGDAAAADGPQETTSGGGDSAADDGAVAMTDATGDDGTDATVDDAPSEDVIADAVPTDGGSPCTPGSVRCASAGVQTCDGSGNWGTAVPCASGTCAVVGGTPSCQGKCTPGATQCAGNAAVQTCASGGTWGAPVPCSNQACVVSGTTASCQGSCAPGSMQCMSNGVSTCSATGTWGTPQPCANQTCLVMGTAASCQGVCAPGQTECASTTAESSCSSTGSWGSPVSCTNQTCVGTGAGSSCQGTCAPGQTQCSGNQPQSCSATGTWQNSGASCGGRVCFNGACTGADCSTYSAPVCAAGVTCDLRSNTCCVTESLTPTGTCHAGTTATYSAGQAAYHCLYSCDCPAGDSCCGELNGSTFAGTAVCQRVAGGGSCAVTAGYTVSAQLCEQSEECMNGQNCIAQTCVFGSHFKFCGLQSQAPYNCTADPTDAGPG